MLNRVARLARAVAPFTLVLTSAVPVFAQATTSPASPITIAPVATATPDAPAAKAAPTTKAAAAPKPPPFTVVRYEEDYGYLADPARRTGLFDPIKYIPLPFVDDKDFYISFGGNIRERYEFYNNLAFGAGRQSNSGYSLTRFLFNADIHASKYFRVFAQGKSSIQGGREPGPRATDRDDIDLQQLFADFSIPWTDDFTTTIRAGRQELMYGAQRVIGAADWGNVRRTFEGVKVINEFKTENYRNTLDAFLTRPVAVNPEDFNNGDQDQTFWGVYDTVLLPNLLEKANTKIEAYVLGLHQTRNASRSFDAETYTVGVHFNTKPKPFDIDTELAYQFGDRNGAEINAWMYALETGYTLAEAPGTPRFFVGVDYATGDGNGTRDGRFERWNPLFVVNHRYLGEVDIIARVNVISPNVGVDFLLAKNTSWAQSLNLKTTYWAFFKENDGDVIYNESTGNSALSRPVASREPFLGHEVDVALNCQLNRFTNVSLAYAHFFAGDYVNASSGGNTAIAQDIDFFYLQFNFAF